MMRNRLALMAALALGMGSVSPIQPAPIVRAEAPRLRREVKRIRGASAISYKFGYMKHGPTMAQQKRAASKARNVKRHKRSARG